MPVCCVPGCTISHRRNGRYSNSIKLHRLPADPTRAKLWLTSIPREWDSQTARRPQNRSIYVCSLHFMEGKYALHIDKADLRFAPNQWETALLCNNFSHWLGASLESALYQDDVMTWTCFLHCCPFVRGVHLLLVVPLSNPLCVGFSSQRARTWVFSSMLTWKKKNSPESSCQWFEML